MTRKEMVMLCLLEAANGDPSSLTVLLNYLRDILNIPIERILLIAERSFDIPIPVARDTFYLLRPQDCL